MASRSRTAARAGAEWRGEVNGEKLDPLVDHHFRGERAVQPPRQKNHRPHGMPPHGRLHDAQLRSRSYSEGESGARIRGDLPHAGQSGSFGTESVVTVASSVSN